MVLSTVIVITFISLQNYTRSLTSSGKQYLINYVRGKSYSTYLKLDGLVKGLETLGKNAQVLLDDKETYAKSYNSLVKDRKSFYQLIEYPPLSLTKSEYSKLLKSSGDSKFIVNRAYKYNQKEKKYKFNPKISSYNRKVLATILRDNGFKVSMSSRI